MENTTLDSSFENEGMSFVFHSKFRWGANDAGGISITYAQNQDGEHPAFEFETFGALPF